MTSRKINCYYPDIGSIRCRTMFNCIIQSRISQMSVEDIHILFSYKRVLRSSSFQYNHYVPIIFHASKKPALKRKNFNLKKKGEKKVKKVELNSQNTQKRLPFPKAFEKHLSQESINVPCNEPQVLKNVQSKLSFSKCKPKNENSVQFELLLKVNDSGSEIQSLSSNSAIDQSLPLKVSDSSSQTQSVPSNSAVDQPHLLNVSSSNSKPDIKAADRVLSEASINLENEEVLTPNVASNKISFPSFLKVNLDLPNLKTKEHTYKYDIANFRYRGSNLSDIQGKEIITNVFVPNSSFDFPKLDGRQFKREWLKQLPWLCYSTSMDGGFCLACVLFGHEFAKGSKVK